MTNDIELEAFCYRAIKVRLIAEGIYDAKERLAVIAFVSDAEKLAAELIANKRQRTWELSCSMSAKGRKRTFARNAHDTQPRFRPRP